MKTLLSIVAVLGLGLGVWAQSTDGVSDMKEMETKRLPEIVIKKAGSDFSVYLPEYENQDKKIKKIQEAFVAYDLGKDYEGNDNYFVTMKLKDASLVATYDANGKLTRVVEKYENVKLPLAVVYGVYRNYPGWKIENDQYLYSQADGDVLKKEYKIKLTRNKESKRIVVASTGAIIKG